VILAGCTVSPQQRPPDVDLTPQPQLAMVAKPKVTVPTNAPSVTNHVLPPPTNHVEIVETWVSLARFCESNGLAPPRRTLTPDSTLYSFVTADGTMTFKVGNKMATWRGADFDLGFAPEMSGGEPFIHSLDIRKNLLPLLEIAPRTNAVHEIVIDPGHGGTDTGTKSVFNGHFEKEYTLDLAQRLKTILASNGWTVWLTRTSDVNMPISNRVAFAESHKAGLFISLHYNSAFPDQGEAGLETYCLTPKGMSSNLTRGYSDDENALFPNNNFDAENLQLAFLLHRAVLKVNGHADRGVRRARFLGVLQNQNRPAVLMEGGYLSNPREARRIADPAYRQKVAAILGETLVTNFSSPMNLVTQATPASPATNKVETNQAVHINGAEGQSE
jgi:N-acetylmuramoyl-L-alanine amidase